MRRPMREVAEVGEFVGERVEDGAATQRAPAAAEAVNADANRRDPRLPIALAELPRERMDAGFEPEAAEGELPSHAMCCAV